MAVRYEEEAARLELSETAQGTAQRLEELAQKLKEGEQVYMWELDLFLGCCEELRGIVFRELRDRRGVRRARVRGE